MSDQPPEKKGFRPISAEERARIREKVEKARAAQGPLHALKEHLLGLAGEQVELDRRYPFVEDLIERGEAWNALEVQPAASLHPNVHVAVAKLWLEHPDAFRIATGYALDDEGTWHCHSWLVMGKQQVHETTRNMRTYFGLILESGDEARAFFEALVQEHWEE